jgi:N-acetyltransferase
MGAVTTDWLEPKELRGSLLRLVPLRTDDAAEFRVALGAPDAAAEVLAHLAYPPPTDDESARQVIQQLLAFDDRVVYAQRLQPTGELVGVTSFYEISPNVRALAIGQTWVARAHWRTGVNTESKLLMLTRAFDGLGAERVVWHTDIRNVRSQAAIERLGATREGVLRHHRLRRDGSWRDTVQYSMLSEEWPEVRRRLEQTRRDRWSNG